VTSPAYPKNVISIAGPSGSGKTELICRLLAWLTARGLKVAVLKHSHKTGLAESDAARTYRQAGAKAIAQAGPSLLQVSRYEAGEPELTEILARLSPQADLVIVEGYKQSALPKLALAWPEPAEVPMDVSRVVAWVGRAPLDTILPVFQADEVAKIGSFVLKYVRQTGLRF
jgi:molybdopterin-guanine dinucleotide biosynthesis adapter protein